MARKEVGWKEMENEVVVNLDQEQDTLIDRDSLIDLIKARLENDDAVSRSDVMKVIAKISKVPVVGRWIHLRGDMFECSECGHVYTDLSMERTGMNFCPNCGVKMVVVKE